MTSRGAAGGLVVAEQLRILQKKHEEHKAKQRLVLASILTAARHAVERVLTHHRRYSRKVRNYSRCGLLPHAPSRLGRLPADRTPTVEG